MLRIVLGINTAVEAWGGIVLAPAARFRDSLTPSWEGPCLIFNSLFLPLFFEDDFNLFFFLTLYLMKLLTFEWYLTESIFLFFTSTSNFKSFYSLLLVWALIIFCIFLKCGLVPFFFWKPVFFKGLTSHVLFFYLTFYYFFLLLFFIIFFLSHVNELFFFYSSVFLFFSAESYRLAPFDIQAVKYSYIFSHLKSPYCEKKRKNTGAICEDMNPGLAFVIAVQR